MPSPHRRRPCPMARPPGPRSVSALAVAVLALSPLPSVVHAQTPQPRSAAHWCDENRGNRAQERVCDVREMRLDAGASLTVNGGANGGIHVRGWEGGDLLVRARVDARARSMEAAQDIFDEIRVETSGDRIRSDGPRTGRGEGWSVSYEIFVPRTMDLDLRTTNGGIHIEDVAGDIRFGATNGGVVLSRLAGQVEGGTTNGGLRVELSGDRWSGQGLDVRTTNGGVRLDVPAGYSARLEAGTTNGGLSVDFPVMVQGRLGRRLTATLGDGGAPIRVSTTNGGVQIRGS